MKEKNGTGFKWIIFSVIVVVIPLGLSVGLSCIINSRPPEFSEILDSIILVVFSIACSLLSICYEVNKQKNDRFVKFVLAFSVVIIFIAWTSYTISLTRTLSNFAKCISIISSVIIIICSGLGIKIGKKSDQNENQTIQAMHNNCDVIRTTLLSQECNNRLKPHTLYDNDLLCNPDEFDRVKETINNILYSGEWNENK